MDNVFTFESMPIADFCREPKGSTAIYLCKWSDLSAAQNRITGKFHHVSLPVKGKCTLKSYIVTDAVTGEASRMIIATVIKPVPPRQKRGRKPRKK